MVNSTTYNNDGTLKVEVVPVIEEQNEKVSHNSLCADERKLENGLFFNPEFYISSHFKQINFRFRVFERKKDNLKIFNSSDYSSLITNENCSSLPSTFSCESKWLSDHIIDCCCILLLKNRSDILCLDTYYNKYDHVIR